MDKPPACSSRQANVSGNPFSSQIRSQVSNESASGCQRPGFGGPRTLPTSWGRGLGEKEVEPVRELSYVHLRLTDGRTGEFKA